MSIPSIYNNNSSFSYNLQPQADRLSQLSSSDLITKYDHPNSLVKPGEIYRDMDGSMKMEQKNIAFVTGEILARVISRINKKISALANANLSDPSSKEIRKRRSTGIREGMGRGIAGRMGSIPACNPFRTQLSECLQEKDASQELERRYYNDLLATQGAEKKCNTNLAIARQTKKQCDSHLITAKQSEKRSNDHFIIAQQDKSRCNNDLTKATTLQKQCASDLDHCNQKERQCNQKLADVQAREKKNDEIFEKSTHVLEKAEQLQVKCDENFIQAKGTMKEAERIKQEDKRIAMACKKQAQKDAGLLRYMYIAAASGFACFFPSFIANIFLVYKYFTSKKRIAHLQQDIRKTWIPPQGEEKNISESQQQQPVNV